jgi:hypothetical protein
MWDRAIEIMHRDLVHLTPANKFLFIAELVPRPNRKTGE